MSPEDAVQPNDAVQPENPVTEQPESGAQASRTFSLEQFPEKLAVVRLPPGAEIPEWTESSSILSITATARETSLVCAGRNVPTKTVAVRGLTAFAVQGTLDPTLVGVLVELLTPLAEAEIPVFTLSTYETDWILIPATEAERAAEAWRRRGHTVVLAVPVKPSRTSKPKQASPSRKQKKNK
ncbi:MULTISPECIES: ACT domain-containing protein [unclassified Nocardioides]|uniref:ACT domain-containing protein n=1 Tax=unclassified Nocardioides TaxID=2615069 RepID=UPI0012974342|nr:MULTISPECIES: ACT domain-containing protein [unclassified Nocardioides]